MANDITTLAIALQSREAEANLKTFNELLTEGSDKAKRMERMTIAVDVDAAVQQLAAFKASFDDIAKSAQNIHFDLGTNMPMLTPPQTPSLDATAMQELKAFFQESAEEMRRQSEALTESLGRIGAGAETGSAGVRTAGESMRGAGAAAGEYAVKLREVNAAKKELAKLSERADADGKAAYEADQRAREAKRDLLQAERELKKVSEQLNATHTGGAGNIMELASKEDALKQEVNSLSEAYKKARAEADKFNAKLDVSAGKADDARARYNQLQSELAGIPAPTGKAAKSVDAFSLGAKKAGTTATKLARGFNAIAFAGGAAVPGLTKVGMAISMFSYAGPYVGAAVIGLGLLSVAIKKVREQSELEAQYIRENAERALKSVQATKEFVSASENDWKRLGELSDVGTLTNSQNEEATAIISRLTEVYGALGIEIDKTTGKMTGYAEARKAANEMERKIQAETLRHAQEEAESALDAQRKAFAKSSEDHLLKQKNDNLLSVLKTGTEFDALNAINAYKEQLQRVMNGQEKMTYTKWTYTQAGPQSAPRQVERTYEISKSEAEKMLKDVEELEKAWDAANTAKRKNEKFKTSEIEDYSKTVGKIATSLKDAENKLVDEDGVLRLKTEEEVYQAQKARISAIGAELKSVREKAAADEMAILDNGKQAGVYLKELELERTNLLEKTLTYEQRISAEKEKQRKALNDAINAEQIRVNTFKSGYILNQNGGLVRQKNADELAKDRTEDIKALQALISEKGYGKTLEEEKDLVAARLELARLEAEQLKYRDQVKAANEARTNAAKGYVFDGNGAVLRKMTEEELNQERQKELADARKRVEAAEKGTVERAQAEAELTRLEIEAYNARKKSSAATVMSEARTNNSRLVQGVEARSSAALALESRVFHRDDSEKAIMRDSKDIQTDIKDAVNNLLTGFTDFSAKFADIKDLLQPL